MASRASSDLKVPQLPGLGTSWYARGGRYWTRRAVSLLVFALVLAGVDALAVDLWRGLSGAFPASARPAADAAMSVLAAVGAVWGWLAARRTMRRQRAESVGPAEARRRKAAGLARSTGLALAGRIAVIILGPVLAPFAAFATAWLLSTLTVREYPSELGARRELAAHGHPPYPPGRTGGAAARA